jgi:hypothetical protein
VRWAGRQGEEARRLSAAGPCAIPPYVSVPGESSSITPGLGATLGGRDGRVHKQLQARQQKPRNNLWPGIAPCGALTGKTQGALLHGIGAQGSEQADEFVGIIGLQN